MFFCLTNLTSLTIPASVTSIGSNAFGYTLALTALTIPANVVSIGSSAFGQSGLTTITFESGSKLASIGSQAFTTSSIASITIPASVTTIDASAFSDDFGQDPRSLTEITVEPANPNFSSIDGVLFNKDASTLIQYPSKKSDTTYSIPAGVTSIGKNAFGRATNLTSVTIPASVTTINLQAFRQTTGLAGVTFLGNTAPTVGTNAFIGVPSSAKAYIKSSATGFAAPGSNWNRLSIAVIYEGVSFNSNGGTAIATGDYLGSITEPTAPTRPGYDFVGWTATDGAETPITFPYAPSGASNITLYAKWTVGTYSVTYDSKGGTEVTDGSFTTGGDFAAPTAPTRAGYTFAGWTATDGGSTNVSFPYAPGVIEGITLYAKWTLDTYTVAFNSKGGTAVTNSSFTVLDDVVQPSEPSRAGYTFAGWTATDGGSAIVSFPYAPSETSNITLYAKWTANVNAVAYNPKGGTAVTDGSFTTGGEFAAPTAPTRAGYTFAGWTATDGGSAIVTFPYAPSATSDITLYAKWTPIAYSVTYDSNGGTAVASGSFTVVNNVARPTAPTREDYSFLGWTVTDGGSTTVTFPYAPGVTSNITLYAKWLSVPPFKPIRSIAPKISGNARQNTLLTSTTGKWTATPAAVTTFQWYRCEKSVSAGRSGFTEWQDCSKISGATKSNYKVGLADQGMRITVLTKATNKMGSTFSTATSVLVPKATAPAMKSAPKISGSVAKGKAVTLSAGTWSANPVANTTQQWFRCEKPVPAGSSEFTEAQDCVKISGATKSTYKVVVADQTNYLTALVTAKNSQGLASESAKSIRVPGTKPDAKTDPKISGVAIVGNELRATTGTWSAIPAATISLAWYRCSTEVAAGATSITSSMGCKAISGATSSTYTVGLADKGKHVTVLVKAKNTEGQALSTAKSLSVKAPPTLRTSPKISGSATVGGTLRATAGTWLAIPAATTSLQWYRCSTEVAAAATSVTSSMGCKAISGATDATYTVETADKGKYLTVLVKARNTGGSASSTAKSVLIKVSPALRTSPKISGSATVGNELQSTTGTWSGIPEATTSLQWYRCTKSVPAGATSITSDMGCKAISGATRSSYTVKTADQGKYLTVLVKAKNAAGSVSATAKSIYVKVPVVKP
jgi:uncharacterized repeat protein (TIGR02543 family)